MSGASLVEDVTNDDAGSMPGDIRNRIQYGGGLLHTWCSSSWRSYSGLVEPTHWEGLCLRGLEGDSWAKVEKGIDLFFLVSQAVFCLWHHHMVASSQAFLHRLGLCLANFFTWFPPP